ncbi:hypothetical protein QJS04_geneDACA022436 [Acorus gramineus]|uniref:Transcription factor TFIIE alpha subunit n=1 Tax=Acorus gramineus TaxID=55184 RepID=A0AAV9BC70_ACOGR|nr:hypothetical protein QJS04_geneDACA022436 [Acorus gramineus]
MKKKLKDELDNRNTIEEYICSNCERRYSTFDALRLISMKDDSFHCEKCDGKLVAESDMLAAEEMGDADNNARRRRREKLKDMLLKIEVQLKPLMDQLARVKDLPALNSEVSKHGKLQMQKLVVLLTVILMLVIPPKLLKDNGMEGRQCHFLVRQRLKLLYQDAFVKAYYTALAERQREQEAATREMQNEEGHNMMPSIISNGVSAAPSDRHVGMKSKREDDGDDDIEWD